MPGAMDPAACTLRGGALSLATAGAESWFMIEPRDRFGNLRGAAPSPDSAREAPGLGQFQAEAVGPGGSVRLGRVVQRPDGRLAVGLTYREAAPHQLGVTWLEAPPRPAASRAAVLWRAAKNQHPPRQRAIEGAPVSSVAQPLQVTVAPAPASAGMDCSAACCEAGSYVSLRGAAAGGVLTAGRTTSAALALRDACGNPAHLRGTAVAAAVLGPWAPPAGGERGAPLPGEMAALAARGALAVAANTSAALGAESEWQFGLRVTRAGHYALQLQIAGRALAQGGLHIDVQAEGAAHAGACTVEPGFGSAPVRASAFSFELVARDQFGNRLSAGGSAFEVRLAPVDGQFQGQDHHHVVVEDHDDGSYTAQAERLLSLGAHVLNVTLGGQHVSASPRTVQVAGGEIDPRLVEVAFGRFPQSLGVREPAGSAARIPRVPVMPMLTDDLIEMRIFGRDASGAATRFGAEAIEISAAHSQLGNVTPDLAALRAVRAQRACTVSDVGEFCDEPPAELARSGAFAYEAVRDGREERNVTFGAVPHAKCRSMSADDEADTAFDNRLRRARYEEYQVVTVNGTENRTRAIVEFLPSTALSEEECKRTCLQHNCSCVTHVDGTGTFRDGSCFMLRAGTSFFLEHFDPRGVDNGSTAFWQERISVRPWHQDHPQSPLVYHLFATLQGLVSLSVRPPPPSPPSY